MDRTRLSYEEGRSREEADSFDEPTIEDEGAAEEEDLEEGGGRQRTSPCLGSPRAKRARGCFQRLRAHSETDRPVSSSELSFEIQATQKNPSLNENSSAPRYNSTQDVEGERSCFVSRPQVPRKLARRVRTLKLTSSPKELHHSSYNNAGCNDREDAPGVSLDASTSTASTAALSAPSSSLQPEVTIICSPPDVNESPLVRKLARLDAHSRQLSLENCSPEMARALVLAQTIPSSPRDLLDILAANDFVMATISLQRFAAMMHEVVAPLLRLALVIPHGVLLCDRSDSRRMLEAAALQLSSTDSQLRAALQSAGYDPSEPEANLAPAGGNYVMPPGGVLSVLSSSSVSATGMAGRVRYKATPIGDRNLRIDFDSLLCVFSASEDVIRKSAADQNVGSCSSDEEEEWEVVEASCIPTEVDAKEDVGSTSSKTVWPQRSRRVNVNVDGNWEELIRQMTIDALDSIPDHSGGSLHILRSVEKLTRITTGQHLNWLIWRSTRSLYAEEVCAEKFEELPSLGLTDAVRMRQASLSGAVDIENFFPFSRDLSRHLYCLPWRSGRRVCARMLESENSLREALREKIPWLARVWELHPEICVTGSILPETLMGDEPTAADVDIVSPEIGGVSAALRDVVDSMEAFGQACGLATPPTVHQTGVDRYTITLGEDDSSTSNSSGSNSASLALAQIAFGPKVSLACFACDLYRNSLTSVARYHLPVVRMALSPQRFFLTPSCAIALATRVNVDYHYFASRAKKSPFEIIAKKWRCHYNFIVNRKEQRLLWAFIAATGGGALGSGVVPSMRPLDGCYWYLRTWRERNDQYIRSRQGAY